MMDPNETLREIRAIQDRMDVRNEERNKAEEAGTMRYEAYDEAQADDRELLCDAYEALDGWVTEGGFLPDEWATRKGAPAPEQAVSAVDLSAVDLAGLAELLPRLADTMAQA